MTDQVVTSPLPVTSPTSKPADPSALNFFEALRYVVDLGGAVTRLEWNKPGTYLTMHGEDLTLHKDEDNLFHPILLRAVDMTATDWVKIILR